MPISSSAASAEKKRAFRIQGKVGTVDHPLKQTQTTKNNATVQCGVVNNNGGRDEKGFLTIGPALPLTSSSDGGGNGGKKLLLARSHSTLGNNGGGGGGRKLLVVADESTTSTSTVFCSSSSSSSTSVVESNILLQTSEADGSMFVCRNEKEKEKMPDRLSLDRRGLSSVPLINNEPRLRLLSLQHNLISDLEKLKSQNFPFLVFLDVYDNQLEKISSLDLLENLRVLLMGKNRLKKIEGLDKLQKLEVLDLHGNQIQIVNGLSNLRDLKVLNLAGNQIKCIGTLDLQGLTSLQELNLRRNKIKKLLGFGETPNLLKLFLSNNEIYSIEDMASVAKANCIREVAIDINPVQLNGGDCVSFLVSYLPQLVALNGMQVTEQVRKAANAWRRNKESSNVAFMDLGSDVTSTIRREEVISNARTNWELLRSQTKCLSATNTQGAVNQTKNVNPDNDFILTSFTKTLKPQHQVQNSSLKPKGTSTKNLGSGSFKIPSVLPDKFGNNSKQIGRTSSQDSQNTSSSNTSSEFIRLPPILVPIIHKLETKMNNEQNAGVKLSGSLSSIGPNVDSSMSSLHSSSSSDQDDDDDDETSTSQEDDDEQQQKENLVENDVHEGQQTATPTSTNDVESNELPSTNQHQQPVQASDVQLQNQVHQVQVQDSSGSSVISSTQSSVSSVNLPPPTPSLVNMTPDQINGNMAAVSTTPARSSRSRTVKSALNSRAVPMKALGRATTAKPNKNFGNNRDPSPKVITSPIRDREQGGDYLIEISGRHLNIFGQGALRYVDKSWNSSKASDVITVHFHYINFNNITAILNRLKHRFINAESFVFKETNISHLGQLNALAEVQGLTHLTIEKDGNPIVEKNWKPFAIYRLFHWGLRTINGQEISEEDVKKANEEYQSLSDLVLWSLPDFLLQPLLVRLHIDVNVNGGSEENAKKWLLTADPALKSVVSKEALQWKKGQVPQEDLQLRHKARVHVGALLEEMSNAIHKLRYLEQEWPNILVELVRNILLDYTQLDLYMKRKLQELK